MEQIDFHRYLRLNKFDPYNQYNVLWVLYVLNLS